MQSLPFELHIIISQYGRYKDNLMLKAISKYFRNLINPDAIAYEKLPIINVKKENSNVLYLTYESNLKFKFQVYDKIIYAGYKGDIFRLLTINSIYNYTYSIFKFSDYRYILISQCQSIKNLIYSDVKHAIINM